MPSDPRVSIALEMLAPPIEQYRTAVATTLEEVRGYLEAGRAGAQARARRLEDQLGIFGAGRIDATRLAAVLSQQDALDGAALARLARASDALRNVVSRGLDLFHLTVPPGGDPQAEISKRLSAVGRAFAAARIAAAARKGGGSGLDEAVALKEFPFSEWNTAERKLAPALVVSANGPDVAAGALAPLLDGGLKLLLILDGPCPPALLARLITPGVFVIQTHSVRDAAPMAAWQGPAIGALVPDTAVRFVHDPAAGAESSERLTIEMPANSRLGRIGSLTPWQQNEEVRLLQALSGRPAVPPVPVAAAAAAAAGPGADAVDRLASWLLQQANMAIPAAGE